MDNKNVALARDSAIPRATVRVPLPHECASPGTPCRQGEIQVVPEKSPLRFTGISNGTFYIIPVTLN